MSEGLQKRVREWVNEYLLKLAVSEGTRTMILGTGPHGPV